VITDADFAALLRARAEDPGAVAAAAARRRRVSPTELARSGDLLIVAADHPARGKLRIGADPVAIGRRRDFLDRLTTALAHPRADGVLATPDIVEELLLLGALEGKLVVGSMNRGGLAGSAWELDDRFTAYDVDHLVAGGLDGGKMLLRIDLDDPGTNSTLEACAGAITHLADRGLMALVEALAVRRRPDGELVLSPSSADQILALSVASGLGATSARTWLKVAPSADLDEIMAATTLPALLLGGDPGNEEVYATWEAALAIPNVRGLVAGRPLLYPPDGDVAAALDRTARLLKGER
jgi:hypothetical protein